MNQDARQLNAAITGQQSGAEVALHNIAAQYPWYAWGAIGAAVANPADAAALQMAATFVHHPLHLQLLLVAQAAEPETLHTAEEAASVPAEEIIAHDEPETVAEEPEVAIRQEAAPASEPAPQASAEDAEPELKIPGIKAVAQDTPAFQPYYTVDYFASQGIKVDLSAEPRTRFDTQLRSFTQWLKTMKKIDYQGGTGDALDPLVQKQAQTSLRPNEVVTESMAEVLIKQGKHQQAIEMLAKLILLHPEKSHFFAAQIENIKAQQ